MANKSKALMADVVFRNGVIQTLDPQVGVVDSIAFKDGKVLAVGKVADQFAAKKSIDLNGSFAMPGLLDVHNHHLIAGQMELFELVFPPTLSFEELLERLRTEAAQLEDGAWIVGGSWGSGLLQSLNCSEALKAIDEATGSHPLLLKDDSKHNRLVNSKAMELAGIDDATEDPDGGQILRDGEGRATGVLLEAAGVIVEQTYSALCPQTDEDLEAAASRGIEILHSYGITAFQDAASSLQLMRALKRLDDSGQLKSWVVTSMAANDFIFGTQPLGEGIIENCEETRSRHHRPDFIKIFLDGVPPAGTAAFLEPYLEGIGFPQCHCGGTTMPVAELEEWLKSTAKRGISAKIHCTGDASVRYVLDAVQKVRELGYEDTLYHVAHGQFVHEEDIPRFQELNVVADISPALWFPGVISEAIATVLPPERAEKMQPNRSLLDSGAIISGGSDWPVSETPNVWAAIYGLVTRKNPTGEFSGQLWADQAITLEEAIAAYTTAPAYAMGLGDQVGRLEPGLSADMVILSSNPYEISLEEIKEIVAMETWFAGECVFSRQAVVS